MNELYNGKLKGNAKTLRKNMTKQERHLWYDFLKHLPVTVHRQKIIGDYIVDFYCHKAKLVIELDGSQHFEDPAYDKERDAFLEKQGLTVLHFPNNAVNENFSGVCEAINSYIQPGGLI